MASPSSAQSSSDTHVIVDNGVGEGEPLSVRAYRIADVCKLTGLGRTSVYAAIKSGDLVARKCNRCTIVLGDDLARFLNNLSKVG
jgi:Helix-turn-helix domain